MARAARAGVFRHGGVQGAPTDPVMLLSLLRDVARGLAYLHACNVVHADLKVCSSGARGAGSCL